jgi:hypothetical protein
MGLRTYCEAVSRTASKEFLSFYETRKFITMSMRDRHCPCLELDESNPYHTILFV